MPQTIRLALCALAVCTCQPVRLDVIITEISTSDSNPDNTAKATDSTFSAGSTNVPMTDTSEAVTTGASLGTSTGDSTADGGQTDTGSTAGDVELCIPKSYQKCSGGHVHWFDNCNVLGELAEDCGVTGPFDAPYCMGDDVYRDVKIVGCDVATCISDIVPALQNTCGEGCLDGACIGDCTHSYTVTSFACDDWTSADGMGDGGGEVMRVCGTADANTGFMTVRTRKFDGSTFGDRPYQVRVSQQADGSCGPDTPYFVVSDQSPSGVGSDELTFTFQSIWEPGQIEKAYCVTASTKPGDPGYDGNINGQKSWWWSDKFVLTRTCG